MSQQKAILFRIDADISEGFIVTKDVPKASAGELLVKVEVAALAPGEAKIVREKFFPAEEFPICLGTDGAGIVEEVGEGVDWFAKGDRVLFQAPITARNATFQQYAIALPQLTTKVPQKMHLSDAVTIPLGLSTAALGLYAPPDVGVAGLVAPWKESGKGKYRNKPIVILGGSSSVGQYVIQLAKMSGFDPIITTASPRHASHIKTLGATHVVDRSGDIVSEIRAKLADPSGSAAGQPLNVEVIFDAVASDETMSAAWTLLAPSGTLVVVNPPTVAPQEGETKRVGMVMDNVRDPAKREWLADLYKVLEKWLEDGAVQPNRVEILPDGLRSIPGGLVRLERGEVSGVKLVVLPQETK